MELGGRNFDQTLETFEISFILRNQTSTARGRAEEDRLRYLIEEFKTEAPWEIPPHSEERHVQETRSTYDIKRLRYEGLETTRPGLLHRAFGVLSRGWGTETV